MELELRVLAVPLGEMAMAEHEWVVNRVLCLSEH